MCGSTKVCDGVGPAASRKKVSGVSSRQGIDATTDCCLLPEDSSTYVRSVFDTFCSVRLTGFAFECSDFCTRTLLSLALKTRLTPGLIGTCSSPSWISKFFNARIVTSTSADFVAASPVCVSTLSGLEDAKSAERVKDVKAVGRLPYTCFR